jgi:hypothetical protein
MRLSKVENQNLQAQNTVQSDKQPMPEPVATVTEKSPIKVGSPIIVEKPSPIVKRSGTRHVERVAPAEAKVKLMPGERSYLQTIAKLDTAIKSDKNAMRPALQVEYERNLAVVDRAIAATRSAAKSNPNDPDAADFMYAA